MRKCIGFVVLALAVATLALPTPTAYAGPNVGSSQSDAPSSTHQFTITNKSNKTITYKVWWENTNNSYEDTLAPGKSYWYSIGPNSDGSYARPFITYCPTVGDSTETTVLLHGNPVTDGQTGTFGSPNLYNFYNTGSKTIKIYHHSQ
jgi:hypothetical protein